VLLRDAGIAVSIISHKTRYSAAPPPFDLQAAALGWLERHRFFARNGFALDPQRVFFESTRAEKIRRIERESCAVFVDDLEEVLRDPTFPPAVEPWLYEHGSSERVRSGVRCFSSWASLGRHLRELQGR
jgi:hypothetical protein